MIYRVPKLLFDQKNVIITDIVEFIEEANEEGESVLVHSLRGQSRACCALSVYFMIKHKWTLYKTLEYLNSRRPDLEIRASFFHQLTQLEGQLQKMGMGATSGSWDLNEPGIDALELLMRNTYQNSKNL